jgi:hypothetical protein
MVTERANVKKIKRRITDEDLGIILSLRLVISRLPKSARILASKEELWAPEGAILPEYSSDK